MVSRKRSSESGFTLIELIIVVTIVGLLAGIALVNVRHAQRKAAENILKANLTNMRKAIDDFYADKQRFPSALQELVDEKYMRRIPPDPITKSADTWIEVRDEANDSGFETSSDLNNSGAPGVVDVKSGATGQTIDDPPVAYDTL